MSLKKVAIVLVVFSSTSIFAHSGGTDKYGCHAGSQPRHCHNSTDTSKSSSGSDFSSADAGKVVAGLLGAYLIAQQVSRSQVVTNPKKIK